MQKFLLIVCGVINALFVAFHLFLSHAIQRMPGLAPGYRALMQALNVGGALLLVFLSVAFLACRADLRTRLGSMTIALGAAVYLTRAAAEFMFFPVVHPLVVVACAVTATLHLAAWITTAERPQPA